MTNLELIFTMLGEEVTRNLATSEDAQGFVELTTLHQNVSNAPLRHRHATHITQLILQRQHMLLIGR